MEYFSKQSWVKFIVSEKWNDDEIYINFSLNRKRRNIEKKERRFWTPPPAKFFVSSIQLLRYVVVNLLVHVQVYRF